MASNGSRRANGEGSKPLQRKDGRWACSVLMPDKRHWFYGSTKAIAHEKMKDFLRSPAAANPHATQFHTIEALLNSWLARKKLVTRDKTYRGYESVVRIHLNERIGTINPAKFTVKDVNTLFADMRRAKRAGFKKAKGLVGERTIELAYIILKSAFRKINPDLMDDEEVHKPTHESEHFEVWTPDEAKLFLEYVDGIKHPHRALYRLMLESGARIGEAMGLQRQDVDLRTAYMSITKTWLPESLKLGPPKTRSSRRRVKISERSCRALRMHLKELLARGLSGSTFFFAGPGGGALDYRNLAKETKRLMRRAGVKVIRLHDMRHTFATTALLKGVPAKVVSEMLGHRSVSITLDIYSHVLPAMQESAAETISEAYQ